MSIASITNIDNQKHIAILDTSSVSFMQYLQRRNFVADEILKDYDLVLIPRWVLTEITDSALSIAYVESLVDKGYPIYKIDEENYSSLVEGQETYLFQIVKASANQLAQVRSYLRRFVEKGDPLDMEAYDEWIKKLYDEWPIYSNSTASGRQKKKNAGEISITILAEVISWYYPTSDSITIYSQDSDTREFQSSAEEQLRKVFASRIPIPVSYKSNDAIICQLYRSGNISEDEIRVIRKAERKITYSKTLRDESVVLTTELLNTEDFINLIKDCTTRIVF